MILRVLLLCLSGLSANLGIAAETLKIYTVNYPLYYFAKRIAADHADVVFPAPPGIDPAFWEPSVAMINDYQKADLILLNGANYAQWLKKASLPRSRLVNTSKTFADSYIMIENVSTHSHGPTGEHSHTGTAWTTWLDFQQAILQAQTIKKALARKLPAHKHTFEQNFNLLEQDLLALDQQLTDLVATKPGQALLASHPVYQYLKRRYQLNLVSLHWEPDEVPDKEQWATLQGILKDHPADWMLWEGEPLAESVHKLAERKVTSVVFDPSANVPEQGDWLSVMQSNIANLKPLFAIP